MSESESPKTGRRRCVGCREMADEADLERFVFHDEVGLVYDMRGGAPGSEAHAHPLRGCLRAACWAGFARAFERPMDDIEADEVVEDVRSGLQRRLAEQMGEAARFEGLDVGLGTVERNRESGDLALVLSLHDGPADRVERLDDEGGVPVYDIARTLLGDSLELGEVDRVGVRAGDRGDIVGRTVEKLVCIEWDEG